MDEIKNPFAPGAGTRPPELVGRASIINDAKVLLARVKQGRSQQSMIMTGLRGVGKTVLLNYIDEIAGTELEYQTILIEAQEGKSLESLVSHYFTRLLYNLDRSFRANSKIRRGLSVMKSFVSRLKIEYEGVKLGLDVDPEVGTSDTGDLEFDLPELFTAVAEAAKDNGTAIALLIDEIQYFNKAELGALIVSMHKIQQMQLPLVLIAAGLPSLPGLAGEAKSYAERLFDYPIVGPLTKDEVTEALQDPVKNLGVEFSIDALSTVNNITKGYPYFVQEWGYQAWRVATSSPINNRVIEDASNIAIPRLDRNFFRVRYDRLVPSEQLVLRAMAELGPGPYKTGDVAQILGVKVTSLGPARAQLIRKGMVYSPMHGLLAFTVPMFDAFMKRQIPTFSPTQK